MLATLEPELLRSFVAIAETGSFTAAASRVHRTQSAVSMQIKRLEELLGRALFVREGRSVSLTRDGDTLLAHARRILRSHGEALAAFDRDALAGEVTIGAPDDYASTFLPRILARFAENHARVHVNVVCQPSVELLRRLAERTVDLALVTQGSGERGGTVVHHEPLVWVTSARHRVHEQEPLPLAIFEPGCSFRRAATESLATHRPRHAHRLYQRQHRRDPRGPRCRARGQRADAQQCSARPADTRRSATASRHCRRPASRCSEPHARRRR